MSFKICLEYSATVAEIFIFIKLVSHVGFIILAKLYTPSTLNIDFIQWHTQLNVCAVK